MSRKIKLNFTPFLRRIYVVSCNPARLSCGCFAVPPWVRRWLPFQQNNGEQYSDTTDSQPIRHRQSIATYRPRCRPTYRPIYRPILGRHVCRLSVDMSVDCRSTYRPRVSTDRGLNRPFSNSHGWTGSSMKWRLMRASLFKCKLICPH